ncbi:MAG: hypothetical protein SFZ24_02950 [Planctomycetota bacterium]|nr:hypothetical protein [Planctomycetota bacterium]
MPTLTNTPRRNYAALAPPANPPHDRGPRAAALIDALWNALAPTGVSWIGVYVGPRERTDDGRTAAEDEMLLGPCRNKPACSPIGLHGVCGRGWRERRSVVVRDVAVLGPDYVACDPKDRSEAVVPLFDELAACWGVIDADSFDLASFTEEDARQLAALAYAWRLTKRPPEKLDVTVL